MSEPVRVLLFGCDNPIWTTVAGLPTGAGYSFQPIAACMEPADIAAQARQGDSVVVVDLSADLLRGIEIVSACRRSAPSAPVIAVADNPSVELTRSIRASGVFYLAVHPLAVEEILSILESACSSPGRNKPSASACRTRRRVLVVEDDPDFSTTLKALLEGEGHAVICACSAEEGLRRASTEKPDLVILDIMMENDWAGYSLNQALKFGDPAGALPETPIMMVSSIPQPPGALFPTSGEVGMVTPDLYMTKPLDIPLFLKNVRSLLSRAGKWSPA